MKILIDNVRLHLLLEQKNQYSFEDLLNDINKLNEIAARFGKNLVMK